MSESKIIPGDVVWRLYDTYGFPVDLTELMVEEKGLKVDCESFESAKKEAQIRSKAGGNTVEELIDLDVHAITNLKDTGVPITNDKPKYQYTSNESGEYSTGFIVLINS